MKAAPFGSPGRLLAVLLLAQRGASFALLGCVAAEGYSLPLVSGHAFALHAA